MDCTRCPLCDVPGSSLSSSQEVLRVRSNVRRCATDEFTVWRCPSCRSIHAKEHVDLPAYYSFYPLKEQKLDYGNIAGFSMRLFHMKRHGLRKNARILDYGCGVGLFVDYLRSRGYDAQGYDPHVVRFRDAGVLESTYDAVATFDVIEHDDDPKAFLERIKRRIDPGGLVVIGTPDANTIDLGSAHEFAFELHQPYHRHILSEQMLVQLAREAGLGLKGVRRRFCYDTPYPGVNAQFIWRYAQSCDNTLDAILDMPRLDVLRKRPSLIVWGLLGYFLPRKGSLVAYFEG